MKRLGLLHEFWLFLRESKKYWLAPIIIILVLLGAFLVFAQSSAPRPVYLFNFLASVGTLIVHPQKLRLAHRERSIRRKASCAILNASRRCDTPR